MDDGDCAYCYQPYSYCTCDTNLNPQDNTCRNCGFSYDCCDCNQLEKKESEDLMVPSYTGNYRSMDTKGILKQREYLINSIGNDGYGLTKEEATLIFISLNWSKDTFDLNWWDKQEKKKKKSGLIIDKKAEKLLKSHDIPDSSTFCLVCYCDEKLFSLSCKHHFCAYCWTDYLKLKSDDFLCALSTTCLQKDCPLIVPESIFFKFLKGSECTVQLNNFQKTITRNFISTNKTLKMCTSPNCNYIIESYSGRPMEVKCLCGNMFCFGCEKNSHRPICCNILNKWEDCHSKESADDIWIKANCKTCPHCKQSIERSTGCLYMHCSKKAGGCGKSFCYVCETDWEKHTQDHFTCNKYTPSVSKKQDEAAILKEELKRMEHFYSRFTNFKVSQEMARKLRPKIQDIQTQLIAMSMPYNELKFLDEAIDCIIITNNTIKNTYVFGYYLRECQEKALFEYNQGMLEKNSNALYKLVDIDLNKVLELSDTDGFTKFKEQFDLLKIKAVNYTSTSLKFQEGVNNYVETPELQDLLDLEGKHKKIIVPEKNMKSDWPGYTYKYINEADKK